ncbi:PREDICTED: anoctamin-8-like isoform X1 [Branchiostoma belcheri]|uniref:Anoctamin n=1 Tax=Branchiostoma belcheri TaxID=7741 RepID=A0A6P4Y575_BRABE|nr:PREDICTED: anoctamin-8-like isoform X1 [Branchiostoma belcheri]
MEKEGPGVDRAGCVGGAAKTDAPTDSPGRRLHQQVMQKLNQACEGPTGQAIASKLQKTGHLVQTTMEWMRTIPTRDCDILMTFPNNTGDHTLMWLLSRLRSRMPALGVHVRYLPHLKVWGFYMTATYDNLLRYAEELGLKKTVKPEFGGGKKHFLYEEKESFDGVEDEMTFFSSQERQSIVKYMLDNLRAVAGDKLKRYVFFEGQPIIPKCLSKGMIKQILPLHRSEDLETLKKTWVHALFKPQPLDYICDYFGVKIAMYCAWLGYYTWALIFPAFFGLVMWFWAGSDEKRDGVVFHVFAMFNVIWATLYLEGWKRRSAVHAYKWGTLDMPSSLLQEPRPLFKGDVVKGSLTSSEVTGRPEITYPSWKRNLFYCFVSVPAVVLCLLVVFCSMLACFELQEVVNQGEDVSAVTRFLPKVLLSLVVMVMDEVYKRIAIWLNDKENYRLQSTYENHLIIKLVLFQFVNSFLSLFYIGFYLQDMTRLEEQLAALLITRQVVGNFKEALVPYLWGKGMLFKMAHSKMKERASGEFQASESTESTLTEGSTEEENTESSTSEKAEEPEGEEETEDGNDDETEEEIIDESPDAVKHGKGFTQAEVESCMQPYMDTFEDYLEMFIQFGYVVLFSPAFPCAAMCALLNNVIEIRSDAFKLCTSQRPFGQRVENIGMWQDVMEVMGMLAVIVNCALLVMSGQMQHMFPGLSTTQLIIMAVVVEHALIALKFILSYAIPDIPEWVEKEMAKVEFKRRQAHKKLEFLRRQNSLIAEDKASPDKSQDKEKTKSSSKTPSTQSTEQKKEQKVKQDKSKGSGHSERKEGSVSISAMPEKQQKVE